MLSLRLRLMLVCIMEDMDMVLVSDMLDLDMDILVLDMLDMEDTVLAMAVWAMLVLATMVRDLLMPSLRLRLMLVCIMEDMDMVLVLDMLDSDMDTPVLDMLDMEDMVLAMAVSAMLVLATMVRDLLMLSPRLMLVCIMEDMDMVLVLDMLDSDMDIPVLDLLDME